MTTIVTIDMGGTGATHAAGAREALSVPSMTDMGQSYAQANSARDQANTARDQANTARNTSNNAYAQANTGRSDANTTFASINTTFETVNTSLSTMNINLSSAQTWANIVSFAAYGQANTARGTANDAYAQANAGYIQANASYIQANAAYGAANTRLSASGGTLSGDLIITGNLTVSGNQTILNTEVLTTEDADIILLSNTSSTPALNAGLIVNRGTSTNTFLRWDEALDEWGWSDSGTTTYYFEDLRQGLSTTNTTFSTINTSLGTINTNYQAAYAQANDAHGQANTAYGQSNAAYGQANAAYGQANAAYTRANTKLDSAGGTISGNLTVTGTLTVSGNVSSINTQSISSVSNEIILNSNASGAPTLDGKLTVNRGSSSNVTLLWNETADKWGWTDNGTTYYYFEDLRQGLSTTNTTFGTINTSYQAAYAQANTAGTNAGNAYGQANAAYAQANSAYGAANNRVLKAGDTMTGGLIIQADAGNEQLVIKRNTNSNEQLIFGFHSSDYASIQAVEQNVAYRPLTLQKDGGNVAIGTTTTTAKLTIGGVTLSQATSALDFNVAGSGTYQRAIRVLNSSMGSANGISFQIGKADSTRNVGQMVYNHVSDGSTDNYVEFGMYGVDQILNLTGNGRVGIGITNPSYKLHVSGDVNASGFFRGGITSSGTGDSNAPFRFSDDYSAWASHWAGTPGSDNGWGLFWAGSSGAKYGTNGVGGPGDIWGNSANPNEAVFVGGGSTAWTCQLNDGHTWQKGNATIAGYITNIRNNASVSAPNTSNHALGTRISLYDGSATSWYAIGIESDTMWFNSDNQYKWYADAVQKMILDSSGNLTATGTVSANQGKFTNRIAVGNGTAPYLNTGTAGIWFSNGGSASHFFGSHDSDNSWLGMYTNGSWRAYLDGSGNWYVSGSVTASYSDERLKDIIGPIDNAIEKIKQIRSVYYKPNELVKSLCPEQEDRTFVGVTAQSVKKVLPEVVVPSAIDKNYDTVHYDRLVALLIAAVQEQQQQIDELKSKLGV